MDSIASQYRFYVAALGAVLGLALLGVFAVNTWIDPLWHFKGNRLGEISYRFEERNMKLNAFMKDPDKYDCIILGASRTTLLDESALGEVGSCFNLAFSLGHVREFRIIAEYLAARGYTPERVIVGVDEVSFQPRAYTDGEKLPEYVLTQTRPKWPIEDYLGRTTLRFSFETLFNPPDFLRGYKRRADGSYEGILMPSSQTYNPQQHELLTDQHFERLDAEMLAEFVSLRNVFPTAEYIGYVPPLSDWRSVRLDLTDNLEIFLDLKFEISKLFEGGFWDFSVPSELTADPSRTADGEHYDVAANAQIAACLSGERAQCGADVRSFERQAYRDATLVPVRERIEREKLTVALEGAE